MFKYLKYLFIILATAAISACSSDEDPAFGGISGHVYDYSSHKPLAGVRVSLMPSSRSIVTDESGSFAFTSLESGSYTVSAELKGYASASSHVVVNIGETARTDISLKGESLMDNFKLSTSSLTFDRGINELTFEIKNVGENGAIKWNINLITVDWLTVTPNEGTLEEGMANVVKVIINRKAIPEGKSVSTSFNVSSGGAAKSISVLVNNVSGGNENPVYGKIIGHVVNGGDMTPVSEATISDTEKGVIAKSNASGNFTMENLTPGNYNFEVNADGFEPMTKKVYVGGGSTVEETFILTPISTTIEVSASTTEIDFGLTAKTRTLTLTNRSNKPAEWYLWETSDYKLPAWLSMSTKSGTIPAKSEKDLTFTVDRSRLEDTFGAYVVTIDGEFEPILITVTAEKETGGGGDEPGKEDYSKAKITTCDSRVTPKIISCRRSGSTVTFEYTLTNNGLGTVNDWRIYPPKSMSLIQGGTRSVVWTDEGTDYPYPTMTFNNKTTTGANVITATFPEGPAVKGSVTITNVSDSAKEFNLTLGVYAYPNSTYHMASSAIQFRNVPIY